MNLNSTLNSSDKLGGIQPVPEKSLKVLLDARKIGDGGIGVYIENTARGLRQYTDIDPTLLITTPELLEKLQWLKDFEVITDRSSSYSLDEYFSLGKRIDFSPYAVYHAPHYTLPFRVPIPKVVTVHDLIHVTHPERFYYPYLAKTMIKSALKRADRVVTVSRASAYELEKLAAKKIDNKLVTIPNVVNPDLKPRKDATDFVSKRFKLDTPFFLIVASNLKPHKGIKDALKAFSNLKRTCKNFPELKSCLDIKLILVGFGAEQIAKSNEYLNLIGSQKDVHLLGRVNTQELIALYGAAQALVVASTAEGFCLPAIEAHAMGTPIVCRPVPAVKELLTSVDVCCESFEISALEKGMRDILVRIESGGVLTEAERLINLQQFDIEVVSQRLAKLYHEIARGV
ncbi:MAG: glycosyltransferase family 1 protein [Bdellovibrionota bacterium]